MNNREQLQSPFIPPTTHQPEMIPPVEQSQPVAVAGDVVHHREGLVPKEGETLATVSVTETVSQAESPVEATVQKGDVFIQPDTGKRQVVEHVLGKGDNRTVLYTKELKPGVPEERGRAIRQLPIKNFFVQVRTGEYDEPDDVSEPDLEPQSKEYDEIFEECQRAFEKYAEVIQLDGSKHYSDRALNIAEKIGQISQEIGRIDDEWIEMSGLTDDATEKERGVMLNQLKEAIARLPAAFLKVYPRLRQVKDAWEDLHTKTEKVHEKKTKVKRVGVDLKTPREDSQRRKGRDTESLELQAIGAKVETKPDARMGKNRKHTEEIDFHAYQQDQEMVARYWEDETIPLADWIDTIRKQQDDLRVVKEEIERLQGSIQWAEALDALGSEHAQFIDAANTNFVSHHLQELEKTFQQTADERSSLAIERQTAKDRARADRSQKLKIERPWLRSTLLMYYEVLRTGERVINQLRQEQSQRSPVERPKARPKDKVPHDLRSEQHRSQRERGPSYHKIQGMLLEAEMLLRDWSDLRGSIDRSQRSEFDRSVRNYLGISHLPQFDSQMRWLEARRDQSHWQKPEAQDDVAKLNEKLRKFGLIVAACRHEVRRFQKQSRRQERPQEIIGSRSLILASLDRALGGQLASLELPVQQVLIDGVAEMNNEKVSYVARAFEILSQEPNLSSSQKGEVVVSILAPGFNAAITQVFSHAGVPIPSAEAIEQIADDALAQQPQLSER